jgi:hypothetical protein
MSQAALFNFPVKTMHSVSATILHQTVDSRAPFQSALTVISLLMMLTGVSPPGSNVLILKSLTHVTGNYIVGLGGSRNGQGFDGPLASFVPEPAVQYQILPSNTWYLTFGDYRQGSLISKDRLGAIVAIDFNNLPANVTVVHDQTGQLDLQSN